MVKTSDNIFRNQKYNAPVVEETSAGGVVVKKINDEWFVALIARVNKYKELAWCLPKGHLEQGETIIETALREVLEETGLVGEIILPLGNIDYWFYNQKNRVHKVVHHYLIKSVSGEITPHNDPDGEIIETAWVPLKILSKRLAFANERNIARIAETKMVNFYNASF